MQNDFKIGDRVHVCVVYHDGSRMEADGTVVGFEDFTLKGEQRRNIRVKSMSFMYETVQPFSPKWLTHI